MRYENKLKDNLDIHENQYRQNRHSSINSNIKQNEFRSFKQEEKNKVIQDAKAYQQRVNAELLKGNEEMLKSNEMRVYLEAQIK